jgi:DNA-binding MarR family transcriptional regulator
VLLWADSGEDAAHEWLLQRPDVFRDLTDGKVQANWHTVREQASQLPTFDGERLAIQIEKEFFRAKDGAEPITRPSPAMHPLAKHDAAVVFKLGDTDPILQVQVAIAESCTVDRDTVKASLDRLGKANLVHQPKGLRQGWGLTDSGRALYLKMIQSR